MMGFNIIYQCHSCNTRTKVWYDYFIQYCAYDAKNAERSDVNEVTKCPNGQCPYRGPGNMRCRAVPCASQRSVRPVKIPVGTETQLDTHDQQLLVGPNVKSQRDIAARCQDIAASEWLLAVSQSVRLWHIRIPS